jgi:hypothetical protein
MELPIRDLDRTALSIRVYFGDAPGQDMWLRKTIQPANVKIPMT